MLSFSPCTLCILCIFSHKLFTSTMSNDTNSAVVVTTEATRNLTTSSDDALMSLLETNAGHIHMSWLICEIITIVMTVILAYVIVTITIFQIRHGKRKERSRSDRNICGRRQSNERVLYAFTMCAAVTAFVRCFLDIDLIFGRYSTLSCTYLKKLKILIAFISVLFGILTYWMRQRIFYANKQLKHIVTKFTRFTSIWILGGLGVIFSAGLLYFMIQNVGYRPLPPYGCSESNNLAPFVLAGSTVFLSQITLALLLVYPIFKKNKLSSSIKSRSSVKGRPNTAVHNRKLMNIVLKTFVTATVAVVSNAIGLALEAVIVTYVDNIGMAIVDVNITVLVLCVVASNADSKRRLLPFYSTVPMSEISTSIQQTSTSHSRTYQPSPALVRGCKNYHMNGRIVTDEKSERSTE